MKVIVVGQGLAGLLSAIAVARGGHQVTDVAFGQSSLPLGPGVADVFGYVSGRPLAQPFDAVAGAVPGHPYNTIGYEATWAGVELLRELVGPLLESQGQRNTLLPTALGVMRPTYLYQPSMAAGALGQPKVIVGLTRLKDFYPSLIAGNLGARAASVDVVARAGEVDTTAMTFARFFDTEAGQAALVDALRPVIGDGEIVGLPAVLGLNDPTAWRQVQDRLGHQVFEIPLPPPSVPGWRLHNALARAAQQTGVSFIRGSRVVSVDLAGGRVDAVVVGSAGHHTRLPLDALVLATGGLASGGLVLEGRLVKEPLLGLPLVGQAGQPFTASAFDQQPAFRAGLSVDAGMRPLGVDGLPIAGNLHAVGGLLAGSIRWEELTREGIAAGSAMAAAQAIEAELA